MYNLLIVNEQFPDEFVESLNENFYTTLCGYGDAADLLKEKGFDVVIYDLEENFSSIELQLAQHQGALKKAAFIFVGYKHSKESLNVRCYFLEAFDLELFSRKVNLLLAMKTL
jgi:hypothetical protein